MEVLPTKHDLAAERLLQYIHQQNRVEDDLGRKLDPDELILNRSPLSEYGIKPKEKVLISQKCGHCGDIDLYEQFRVCQRCKQLGLKKQLSILRRYCSKDCQVKHWRIHRLEHKQMEQSIEVLTKAVREKYRYLHKDRVEELRHNPPDPGQIPGLMEDRKGWSFYQLQTSSLQDPDPQRQVVFKPLSTQQ